MSEVPSESPNKIKPPHHPHAVRASQIAFGILFALVMLNWAAIHFGLVKVPPNAIPWDRPVLDARPGMFAHWQMQRLKTDRQMCRAALDRARDLSYTPLDDMSTGTDCGFNDVVRATKTPIAFNIAPVTTCSLSAALYWWQRDVQRLSRQILKTGIKRIDQLGTYECRNINGAATGNRSEHATANAIDIEAFETADGRRISVKDDWLKPTPEGRFLRAAHDSACTVFGEVLGPDYNNLHANHFHMDEAAWTMCR
ncbi:MAG TPA: extensin family protein [Rhizomicrobium sp.]